MSPDKERELLDTSKASLVPRLSASGGRGSARRAWLTLAGEAQGEPMVNTGRGSGRRAWSTLAGEARKESLVNTGRGCARRAWSTLAGEVEGEPGQHWQGKRKESLVNLQTGSQTFLGLH